MGDVEELEIMRPDHVGRVLVQSNIQGIQMLLVGMSQALSRRDMGEVQRRLMQVNVISRTLREVLSTLDPMMGTGASGGLSEGLSAVPSSLSTPSMLDESGVVFDGVNGPETYGVRMTQELVRQGEKLLERWSDRQDQASLTYLAAAKASADREGDEELSRMIENRIRRILRMRPKSKSKSKSKEETKEVSGS